MTAPSPVNPGTLPIVWHRLDLFLARLRPHREPLSLLADALVVAACRSITELFRLGFERWISAWTSDDGWVLAKVMARHLLALALLRVPKNIWRFSGFGEIKQLTVTRAVAGRVAAVVTTALGLGKAPRAVLALHPFVNLMGLRVVRIPCRMSNEHARSRNTGSESEICRAPVIGAGEAARLLLAGIHQQDWVLPGLLDDDPAKRHLRIVGVQVLGPLQAITDRAVRGAATHIVVALPGATAAQSKCLLNLAVTTSLQMVTSPHVEELRIVKSRVERLRDIKPEDLLGREPLHLDEAGTGATLAGKTVLITGAGGNIGSELRLPAARCAAMRLVLYALSEFNLHTIVQALTNIVPAIELVRLIADFKKLAHLGTTFERWRDLVLFLPAPRSCFSPPPGSLCR